MNLLFYWSCFGVFQYVRDTLQVTVSLEHPVEPQMFQVCKMQQEISQRIALSSPFYSCWKLTTLCSWLAEYICHFGLKCWVHNSIKQPGVSSHFAIYLIPLMLFLMHSLLGKTNLASARYIFKH